MIKRIMKAFRLPEDEYEVNYIINQANVTIVEKQVSIDKSGNVIIFLEYEQEE